MSKVTERSSRSQQRSDVHVCARGLIRRSVKAALFAIAALAGLSTPAAAQTVNINVPDTSRARIQLGPVMLNPVIDLTNLGVDTNVFNQPAGQEQDDFTFTLVPRSDVWMKMGPTWLSCNVREDLV